MIHRQRALIRLIFNEGGRTTLLRLVKLSFLLKATAEVAPNSSLYDFVPYLHGPFSFTLMHELRAIERNGWVRISGNDVELTRPTDDEAVRPDPGLIREIDSLTRRFRSVTTATLVSKVYQEYPWYTVKAKDKSSRRAVIPLSPASVFTIGYEGLMLDGLLDLLLQAGIKRLIDVRRNPIARRFGFHKSTIERHCRDVDIEYSHMPELGIPSSERSNLGNSASYNRLFNYYQDEVLDAQSESLRTLASFMQKEPSALMCMEADSKFCHRSKLAEVIAKTTRLPIRELRVL